MNEINAHTQNELDELLIDPAMEAIKTLASHIQLGVRKNDIAYHYTTASGLMGIVQSQCLWATNLSFVNDAQEIHYGRSVFKDICSRLFQHETRETAKAVLTMVDRTFDDAGDSQVYACCLSENGDQLSQWRGYVGNSKTTTYSIGFNAMELFKNLEYGLPAQAVVYERQTQEKIATKLFSAYLETFLTDSRVKEMSISEKTVVSFMRMALDMICIMFKHSGFSEEKEYRLASYGEDAKDVSVRERNGVLVPYIEMRMKDSGGLPIEKIIIGPGEDFYRAKEGLK